MGLRRVGVGGAGKTAIQYSSINAIPSYTHVRTLALCHCQVRPIEKNLLHCSTIL